MALNYEIITRYHGQFMVNDVTSVKQHGDFTYFKKDTEPVFMVTTKELVVVRTVTR